MGVVISLSTETSARGGDSLDFSTPAVADILSDDPVMQRLVDRLGRSGTSEIVDDGIYADAMRLALAARWLRLRAPEPGKTAPSLQKWRLNRVLAYIDENIGETISLTDLARVSGLSRMYFAAGFRAATGLRPHDYVLQRRIARAKVLLAQSEEPLVNVALDVGFQNQSHFTTVFKRIAGTTPGRWRASTCQPA